MGREALQLVDRITDAGAELVSVTEPFDTSTALGRGVFALMLSLAEAESEKLSERFSVAQAVQRDRGLWLGGPVPYGFGRRRRGSWCRRSVAPSACCAQRSDPRRALGGASLTTLAAS